MLCCNLKAASAAAAATCSNGLPLIRPYKIFRAPSSNPPPIIIIKQQSRVIFRRRGSIPSTVASAEHYKHRRSSTSSSDAVESNSDGSNEVADGGGLSRQAVCDDADVVTRTRTLFPSSHFDPTLPLFWLYAPVGLVVASFRMALWVALLAVDPPAANRDTTIALFRTLLGVSVRWDGEEHLPPDRHVLVSNHLTAGDLIVLYTRPARYVHLVTPAVPTAATEVKNHRVLLRHATPATYDALSNGGDNDAEAPVHLFPEGGMTNGKGMMQFSRGFVRLSRDGPVIPMALRAEIPLRISSHTLTSSFLANLFWFSFAPWVSFHCTVLPAMCREKGEGAGHFASRVQTTIAAELQVPVVDLTIQAKRRIVEREKRRRDKRRG